MSEVKQTNDHRRTNDQMGEIFMDSDILTAHSPLESLTKGDSKEFKHFEGPFNKGKSGFEMLTCKSVENRLLGAANFGKTYNLQLISKTPDYTNVSPTFFSQFKFAISNVYKKKPALNADPEPNSVSKMKKGKSEKNTTEEKKIKNNEKLRESIQKVKINKNNMKIFTKFRGKTLHYHKSTDSNMKSVTKIVEKKEENEQFLNNPSKMPNTELGDRKETKYAKGKLEAVGQKTKKPSLFNMERGANSLYENANSMNAKQSLQPIEPVKSNSTNEKHAIRELVDIYGNKNLQQVSNEPENIQLPSNFETGSRKLVYGEKNINYQISSKINSKSKNCIKQQVNVSQKLNDYRFENNKTMQDDNEIIHMQSEKSKLNLIKPGKIKKNENRLHNDKVELEKEVSSRMKQAEPCLTLKDIKDDIIRGHSLSKTQKKKYSKQHQQTKQNDEILEQNQTEMEREMDIFLKNYNSDEANDDIDDFLMDDSQITKRNKQYTKSQKKKQTDDTLDYDQAMLERHMKDFMKNTKLGETLRIIKKDKGDNFLNDIKVNEHFRKPQPTRKYDDKHQFDKLGMGTKRFMELVGPGSILGNILGVTTENSFGSPTNKGTTQPQKNRQNTQQYDQVEVGKEMGYLMKNTKSGKTTSNFKDDILKGHSIRDNMTNEYSRQPEQNGQDDRLQNDREDIGPSTKNTQPNTTISNTTNDILGGNNKSGEQKNKLNRKSEQNKQVDDIYQIDQAELEREVESLMKNTKPGLTISKVDDMYREHLQSDFQLNENSRQPEHNGQNGDRPQHNQAQPNRRVGDSTTNPYRDKTLLNFTEDIIREYSQREAQANEYSRQHEQTVQSNDTLQFDQAEMEKEMEYLMKNTKLGNDKFADDKINDPSSYSLSNETKSNHGPLKNAFDHTFEEIHTQDEKKPEYSEPAGKTGNEKTKTKNDYLKSLYQLKQELEIVLKFSHLIQPNLFKGVTKFDDSDPLKYDGDGGADDVKYYKKVELDQLHDLVHNTKFNEQVDDFPAEGEGNPFKESSDPNDLDSGHHTTHPRPPSPPLGARHISSIFNEMADQGFGMNSNNESYLHNIVSDIRRQSPGYRGPPQKGDHADWYAKKRDLIEGSRELYKKVIERIDKINRGEDVDYSSSL